MTLFKRISFANFNVKRSILIAFFTWAVAIDPHTVLWAKEYEWVDSQTDRDDFATQVEDWWRDGKLKDAELGLEKEFATGKRDNRIRMALALTKVFRSAEGVAQKLYLHGRPENAYTSIVPYLRLTIKSNPNPKEITYDEIRTYWLELQNELTSALVLLERIEHDESKLTVSIGKVRLDANGDGVLEQDEGLFQIVSMFSRNVPAPVIRQFRVSLDEADAYWLRGYLHALIGMIDIALAYDQRELLDRCGHLLFSNYKGPFEITQLRKQSDNLFDFNSLIDLIAFIHLIDFPVVDGDRLKNAHGHFLSMLRDTKECWRLASLETDDDFEWIPNTKQNNALRIVVDPQAIETWPEVLDEMVEILEGRKLIPYWRLYRSTSINGQKGHFVKSGTGLNLKRMFFEPIPLDLVLISQGTAIEHLLEEGELSTPETWDRLRRLLGGNLFGYAVWFN